MGLFWTKKANGGVNNVQDHLEWVKLYLEPVKMGDAMHCIIAHC